MRKEVINAHRIEPKGLYRAQLQLPEMRSVARSIKWRGSPSDAESQRIAFRNSVHNFGHFDCAIPSEVPERPTATDDQHQPEPVGAPGCTVKTFGGHIRIDRATAACRVRIDTVQLQNIRFRLFDNFPVA